MAGAMSLANNPLSTKGKKMKHVNASLLIAMAKGRTIQFSYCGDEWGPDGYWTDITQESGTALNSVACGLLIAGTQHPEYPMKLRIKPVKE